MRKESKDCRQAREKVKKSVMLLQELVATQSKTLSLGSAGEIIKIIKKAEERRREVA